MFDRSRALGEAAWKPCASESKMIVSHIDFESLNDLETQISHVKAIPGKQRRGTLLEAPSLLTGGVGQRARDKLRKKRARLHKVGCQDDIETVADDTGDWKQMHNGVGYSWKFTLDQ